MKRARWASAVADLRLQWQVNTRLRLGLWLIAGIAWVYALLLLGDAVVAVRSASVVLAEEIDRLRPLARVNPWPARVDDSRRHLAALRSMQWAESAGDIGLAEAAVQDWVRSTAGKAGLRVREMVLARATPATPAAPAAPASMRPQAQAVKLRLTAELGRNELVAFLAEIGRYERVVVVEHLVLRPGLPVGSAEIDLRALASGGPAAPARTAAGGAK
jgi:hypothetical protein